MHRSWTGKEIYRAEFHQDGDYYLAHGFFVERNNEVYKNEDDSIDIKLFNNLLKHLKDRKLWNHPKNAILGLIVGDALGVPVEFQNRESLSKRSVKKMIGYGTHNQPAGTWSDDSSLTLCLADELTKGFDLDKIGKSFVSWLDEGRWTPYGNVFDIGIGTRKAIDRLRKGEVAYLAGDWDEMSNGNGSLMRILPLLFHIRYLPILDRYEITRKVSSITHGHVRAALACFYYLEFAKVLCEYSLPTYAYKMANISLKYIVGELNINEKEYDQFHRLTKGNIHELSQNEIKSSGYVIDTLEASIWCVLTSSSYEESVLKAVNLGEDTDTTGAVTGGLAGLIYSAAAIPLEWLDKIPRLNEIEIVIEQLRLKYKEESR
ncbi:ADP-ribosylglycohydrolase family protein [Marivirga atlantica]|uniref:ADP-ribosylglycohydrolase family protein n=2 Tax=Marivirga atlantica TaxID=1548457 RepID=A0A937DFC4_9BACT|nr:ADP-ribosylglycohydrolase family protein [Marivirga atlantica]